MKTAKKITPIKMSIQNKLSIIFEKCSKFC